MYGAPAPVPSPKTEATLASVTSTPSSKTASPPRRQKPRHVIYKSTALVRAAPALVAAAAPAAIASSKAIKEASAEAERVRDQFKLAKCGPEIDVGDGDDEATNAKKYERRLLMNRHSAAASRVRREAYTKALEAQVVKQEQYIKLILEDVERAKKMLEEQEQQPAAKVDGESDVESDGGFKDTEYDGDGEELDDIEHLDDFPDSIEHLPGFSVPQIPQAAPMPVMESQTEDNDDAFRTQIAAASIPNTAHVPIQGSVVKEETIPKLEEVLSDDYQLPVPVEYVHMVPNDKLIDSFLYTEPVPQVTEFGNLDFS